ncbi:AMP-binding protein [Paenibacillus hexagrammi]|uniref:AMP-binding protein n=1 Tax=Paenibacillus hexagrammi TaxID=2908839 RepID=A0ABY3SD05_9BACL|nr:AMP-binding protein [Paenibacillus sp. YPD9-1]UJF31874.1 AMP-binding protein [Paenibacillus sp. YPD9-1]
MIQIDREQIDRASFSTKINEFNKFEPFRHPEGKAYAICSHDALGLILSVIYLRGQGASVLLLHPDTPFETAKHMSTQAGCSYLQYGRWDDVCTLDGRAPFSEPGLLQFSSGTTGRPKLIFRSWTEVAAEIQAYNSVLKPEPEEISLIMVPVSHSFGLITGVLAALERGAEAVVVQNKNPKFQLRMIGATERSILYAVPYFYHLLLTLGKDTLHFHKLISSGAALTGSLLKQLQSRSRQVWQQYGCTEIGCISLGEQPLSLWDAGYALPHLQVSIQPAAHPEYGEIVVEKPGGVRIQTRDLGSLTDDGRLRLYGRLDDLINVGGLKVIPMEVESVLERMPGIKETVVFRTHHPVYGEAAKALIVADQEVSGAAVKAWCLTHLPSYKIPNFIELVPKLPRLPSGKISRKLLEEQERSKHGQ